MEIFSCSRQKSNCEIQIKSFFTGIMLIYQAFGLLSLRTGNRTIKSIYKIMFTVFTLVQSCVHYIRDFQQMIINIDWDCDA